MLKIHRRQWLALAGGVWLLPAVGATRHEQRVLFGSPADLLLPSDAPRDAVAAVWRGLGAMNARWNAWKPGAVTALNQAFAAGRTAPLSAPLQGLIQGAAVMERLSLGCFNAGIGGLVGGWGFHDDELRPGPRPAGTALAPWRQARPSLMQLQLAGLQVRSDNPWLQLDFGGYAKGVAADRALDRLRRHGVSDAVVNLGGNLAAMGRAEGRPWRVGLRDPLSPGLIGQLAIQGREAVVTSGIYERFRLLDGQLASHILDPVRGEPAMDLISVTVVHPSAALADAAATALVVAGPARWQALAARLGLHQVLAIDRHRRASATAALARRLEGLTPHWQRQLRIV